MEECGTFLPVGVESTVLVKGRAEESETTKLPLGQGSSSQNCPSPKRPEVASCLFSSLHFPEKGGQKGGGTCPRPPAHEEQRQPQAGAGPSISATRGQPSARGLVGGQGTTAGIPLSCPLPLSFPGYGYMAPLSAGGKAFCVVYAALGLPASLALLAALRRCLLPLLSRPGAWVAVQWQLAPASAALLQAAGLGLLVAGAFVLLPALVLWGLQGDCSLLGAIYFCFSSLSTIGLGDLLPGHGRGLHPALYRLGQLALLGESSCPGA